MRLWKILAVMAVFLFIISFIHGQIIGKVIGEFDSDNIFLKIGIAEGGEFVKSIKVSNNNNRNHFSISAKGLDGLVSFDEKEFDLEAGESKDVKVYFKAGDNEPGIYIGKLEIVSEKDFDEIPVVLEIQSKDVLFDSNIRFFPYGQDIISGDTLNVEIRVFDLVNRGVSDVAADYFIKDFDGKTIISESENLIVDSKLDYSKSFKIPEEMEVGSYVLGVVLKYKDSIGTSSIYFEISDVEDEESLFSSSSSYIFLLSGFFLIILIFLGYYFSNRNRLVDEIKRSYKRELKLQRQLYDEKLRAERKLKGQEKTVYRKEVKKVGKQREKALRESYINKLRELRKQKGGDYSSLIKKWKTRGYDTNVIEKKYKYPRIDGIKKKVKEWKSKGYDTRVLEKTG